jgi:hypothetical protein
MHLRKRKRARVERVDGGAQLAKAGAVFLAAAAEGAATHTL